MAIYSTSDWRNEPEISKSIRYKKQFAIFPIKIDNTKVWFENYYDVYITWIYRKTPFKTEYQGRVTEADYLVRKLSDNL